MARPTLVASVTIVYLLMEYEFRLLFTNIQNIVRYYNHLNVPKNNQLYVMIFAMRLLYASLKYLF